MPLSIGQGLASVGRDIGRGLESSGELIFRASEQRKAQRASELSRLLGVSGRAPADVLQAAFSSYGKGEPIDWEAVGLSMQAFGEEQQRDKDVEKGMLYVRGVMEHLPLETLQRILSGLQSGELSSGAVVGETVMPVYESLVAKERAKEEAKQEEKRDKAEAAGVKESRAISSEEREATRFGWSLRKEAREDAQMVRDSWLDTRQKEFDAIKNRTAEELKQIREYFHEEERRALEGRSWLGETFGESDEEIKARITSRQSTAEAQLMAKQLKAEESLLAQRNAMLPPPVPPGSDREALMRAWGGRMKAVGVPLDIIEHVLKANKVLEVK